MFVKSSIAGLLSALISTTLASPVHHSLFKREAEKLCPKISIPESGCVPLIIGQKNSGSEVCYSLADEGKTLVVTYGKIEGYDYEELHLFIGPASGPIPGTAPGQFPYSTGGNGCVINGDGTGTCTVPLGETVPCGQSFYIATHAATGTETVWGQGPCMKVNKNTNKCTPWAMYSTLQITCPPCPTDPEEPTENHCKLGTGFGYSAGSSIPLSELNVQPKIKRWGWYTPIPSSTFTSGGISGDIWVGAGQNDLSKGTNVGTFSVSANPTTKVTKVCITLAAPYDLGAIHIDLDCAVPDKHAKSPGDYWYNADGDLNLSGSSDRTFCKEWSLAETGLSSCINSGNIYFILHIDAWTAKQGVCPEVPIEVEE